MRKVSSKFYAIMVLGTVFAMGCGPDEPEKINAVVYCGTIKKNGKAITTGTATFKFRIFANGEYSGFQQIDHEAQATIAADGTACTTRYNLFMQPNRNEFDIDSVTVQVSTSSGGVLVGAEENESENYDKGASVLTRRGEFNLHADVEAESDLEPLSPEKLFERVLSRKSGLKKQAVYDGKVNNRRDDVRDGSAPANAKSSGSAAI